jgi:hypothetical protein
VENNYNILELFEEVQQLRNAVATLQQDIVELKTKEKKELVEGYYTVDEICIKYKFSRKTFWNYKQIVPLPKSTKTGLMDKYKKVEVEKWYNKILQKKEKTPHLFLPKFIKNKQAS